MRKNEKGSSLIFAVVVIMVIAITIAAALAISFSYYNRSIAANTERQAYLTAKSVLTNIVENIVKEKNDTGKYSSLIPKDTGSAQYTVTDFPETELGKIEDITIAKSLEKDENQVDMESATISVSVLYGNKSKVMNAELKKYKDNRNSNWQLIRYYEGEAIVEGNVSKANKLCQDISSILDFTKKKNKSGLIEYLNQSSDVSGVTFKDNNVYSNSDLLKYVDKVILDGKVIELNIDEFNLPDKMRNKLKDKTLYLHVMFGFQTGGEGTNEWYIVYANTTKSNSSPGWKPELVYLPETQHWYYNVNEWGSNLFEDMAIINTNYVDGKKKMQKMIDACVEANIAQ